MPQTITVDRNNITVKETGPIGPPGMPGGPGGPGEGSGLPEGGAVGAVPVRASGDEVNWSPSPLGTAAFESAADLKNRENHTGDIAAKDADSEVPGVLVVPNFITPGGAIILTNEEDVFEGNDVIITHVSSQRATIGQGELTGRTSKSILSKTADTTLLPSESGATIIGNKATELLLTVANQDDQTYLVPCEYVIANKGVGLVTVVPAAGVTIRNEGLSVPRGRTGRLFRTLVTNEWIFDLSTDVLPQTAAGQGIQITTVGNITYISVPNGVITPAMQQNVTPGRVKGRKAASAAGSEEELSSSDLWAILGMKDVTAITATAYTTLITDYEDVITRDNASASTHVHPSNATAPIPIGSEGVIVNLGAGVVTHSAGGGATLISGSAVTQPQGSEMHWRKVGTNSFLLTLWSNPATRLALSGGDVTGATNFQHGTGEVRLADAEIFAGTTGATAGVNINDGDAYPAAALSRWPFGGAVVIGTGGANRPYAAFVSTANGIAYMLTPDGALPPYFKSGKIWDITAITATAYTHTLADSAKLVTRSNASASTHVLPNNTTAAIPVGTYFEIINIGAGAVTISAEASASLVAGSDTALPQGSKALVQKTATNVWQVSVI